MDIGMPLYRCEDVRAIDRAAIEGDGIPAYELMTRAAQAAFDVLRAAWPHARRVSVVCGPGNNGGDGYVLARLARAAALEVRVVALSSEPGSTADAQRAASEWRTSGGEIETLAAEGSLTGCE
ncbi:MAG: bifunctional ADP-dependent NAD(P)H-hydrate dehydratase/NAD(P)H-hydrate epimerase, partial [Pseudomonadota bacterium]|nr:bifunctional ADP-dependent NAD(P)H-hydrate dehydratase/NAD(P)H-hydrate epimerase [Pseudomonadota bacterium]